MTLEDELLLHVYLNSGSGEPRPTTRSAFSLAKVFQAIIIQQFTSVTLITFACAKCHDRPALLGSTLTLKVVGVDMMLAYKLVRLIETHSDSLTATLLQKVQNSELTHSYRHVPAEDLKDKVGGIYSHLGEWLLGKSTFDIERRYEEIGARRVHQNVPVSELIWVIILTKETLWEFLQKEYAPEKPAEAFGELEMLQLLDQFFDRAIYYASVGYEKALGKQEKAASH